MLVRRDEDLVVAFLLDGTPWKGLERHGRHGTAGRARLVELVVKRHEADHLDIEQFPDLPRRNGGVVGRADNENARGRLSSFLWGGQEWLFIAGGRTGGNRESIRCSDCC